jgi:hypothetical protein
VSRFTVLVIVTIAAGFAGARLFYVIQFWDHFRISPLGILKIWEGGLVLYGGLAGGLLGFFMFVRAKRLPFLACLDLFVIAAALAQGFGRIGCFLNGCCFGLKTQLPFGVSFPFLDHRTADWAAAMEISGGDSRRRVFFDLRIRAILDRIFPRRQCEARFESDARPMDQRCAHPRERFCFGVWKTDKSSSLLNVRVRGLTFFSPASWPIRFLARESSA